MYALSISMGSQIDTLKRERGREQMQAYCRAKHPLSVVRWPGAHSEEPCCLGKFCPGMLRPYRHGMPK